MKTDSFEGWIGTVKGAGQLKDDGESLNKILVMARGKLVQEDILAALEEGGIYTKYLIGEVQSDALDDDNKADIATTSRQALIEDDPRFIALKHSVTRELSYIRDRWTEYRNEGGTKAALESAAIKEWFGELGSDDKSRAKRLFGKINEMTVDQPEDRAILFKHGVLAFHHMKAKKNLDELDNITADNVVELGRIFSTQDDLEATSYYQIVKGRIKVIQALADKVDDDALEKNDSATPVRTLVVTGSFLGKSDWHTLYGEERHYGVRRDQREITGKRKERAGRHQVSYQQRQARHHRTQAKQCYDEYGNFARPS